MNNLHLSNLNFILGGGLNYNEMIHCCQPPSKYCRSLPRVTLSFFGTPKVDINHVIGPLPIAIFYSTKNDL
jgi:hypothetical protein